MPIGSPNPNAAPNPYGMPAQPQFQQTPTMPAAQQWTAPARDVETEKKRNAWQALAMMGLKMASSDNPTFAGALAEGGMTGVGQFNNLQDRDDQKYNETENKAWRQHQSKLAEDQTRYSSEVARINNENTNAQRGFDNGRSVAKDLLAQSNSDRAHGLDLKADTRAEKKDGREAEMHPLEVDAKKTKTKRDQYMNFGPDTDIYSIEGEGLSHVERTGPRSPKGGANGSGGLLVADGKKIDSGQFTAASYVQGALSEPDADGNQSIKPEFKTFMKGKGLFQPWDRAFTEALQNTRDEAEAVAEANKAIGLPEDAIIEFDDGKRDGWLSSDEDPGLLVNGKPYKFPGETKGTDAASGMAPEGTTATNPTTNEKIIVRGGKWEKL